MARPFEFTGKSNHSRTNRVQLDVSHASQQVAIALYQAGFEPPFKESAGPIMALVDETRKPPANRLHHVRQGTMLPTRGKEVDVIAHENVRMQIAAADSQRISEEFHE
ncbi:MAG: hypothetical protein ABIQ72_14905 [Usitatibacter sp.]